MSKPDFEAIFRTSPYPYLVMTNDLTIIGANDAYLRVMGRTEEDIVGRYVFDAFPENPRDPESTNTQELKSSLERAIATGRPDTTAFMRYSVPQETARGTIFTERYWSTVHTPVSGADGKVAFVVQNAIDVTDLYNFNKASQVASVEQKPRVEEGAENFNRAQMHEAMTRILNDERGHLRNLFNQAPGFVAVLTGPKHVFEMVNEAYYRLVGHRDILNKPVWEALPEVAGQGFEALLDRVYETGKAFVGRNMKVSVQRVADGPMSEIYVDFVYQPYLGADGSVEGIFAQGHDVTEAHEAQAAQRESEERLQEGMLAAKMVVWDWDIASRKVVFSDNAPLVLGIKPETIDAFSQGVHPQDLARLNATRVRSIAEKCAYQEVVRFERPDDGKWIWLDVRGKIRSDASGNAYAVRGVTLDITERMHAEEDLRKTDRRKDEFLAMLAHELRNPLAPISAAAQLLQVTHLDGERLKQMSDIISRQVGHIIGLVDDLIDVSRVTRGLISTDKISLDVGRIISDAMEQIAPIIEAKRHHLRIRLAPEPARVVGDHKRLVQVLTNLLNNAAKYTPEGGNIVLSCEVEAEYVVLTVADDGIGISAELLPQVFDLFTQAARTSDRSQGGLGVGLALVKSLVELHGGQVKAFSEGEGKGSEFTIRLPRLQDQHEQLENDSLELQSKAPANPLRIMIVDDNADAAQVLAMLLEAEGHQVWVAHSSREAIQRVTTIAPDVCLLDIGLPEMDGNALASHLRSQPETRDTLLIAITGYGQESDRTNAFAAGFDYHLVKPVDTADLMKMLVNVRQP